MLIPELDKLRDKTMSFGCVLELTEEYISWYFTIPKGENVLYAGFENKYGTVIKIDKVADNPQCNIKYKIAGMPLTYGRIYSLSYKLRNTKSGKHADEILYNKTDIERILKENDLIDKSELERQQSTYWEELKELLIQFSNYL